MLAILLVPIFTGKELSDFPPSEQNLVLQNSVDRFVEWLYAKIMQDANADPQAKSAAIRLKSAHQFHDSSVFTKFPETEKYMMQAYNQLIETLKQKAVQK